MCAIYTINTAPPPIAELIAGVTGGVLDGRKDSRQAIEYLPYGRLLMPGKVLLLMRLSYLRE